MQGASVIIVLDTYLRSSQAMFMNFLSNHIKIFRNFKKASAMDSEEYPVI